MPQKVPVTILTGFLGSGKTTLLNRILGEEHGRRIAVIENEFGEVGIDQALVIDADEEIFEMSNGCICCTVRGDLIRVLGNLMKRRDKFDYVLVETTGLADPGPVAQTFFMDDEIRAEFSLDGIVTLVDAAHIEQQLGRSDESTEQIAFADVLVLNKTDLVNDEKLDGLEARLREMNRMARALGADPATLAGLSGFGDLSLTCSTLQSRNYRFGVALGRGEGFDPKATVEGIATAKATAVQAAELGIDMPISLTVVGLLEGRLKLREAIEQLLSRPLTAE